MGRMTTYSANPLLLLKLVNQSLRILYESSTTSKQTSRLRQRERKKEPTYLKSCFLAILRFLPQITNTLVFYVFRGIRNRKSAANLRCVRFFCLATCARMKAFVATTPLALRWNARFTTNGMCAKKNTICAWRE